MDDLFALADEFEEDEEREKERVMLARATAQAAEAKAAAAPPAALLTASSSSLTQNVPANGVLKLTAAVAAAAAASTRTMTSARQTAATTATATAQLERFSSLRIRYEVDPETGPPEFHRRGYEYVKIGSLSSAHMKKDVFSVAVVVDASLPRASKRGKKYSLWRLSDLSSTESMRQSRTLMLFGAAFEQHFCERVAAAILVINPSFVDDEDAKKTVAASVNSTLMVNKAEQIVVLGTAVDLGRCRASKRNGERCQLLVNAARADYCEFHAAPATKKAVKAITRRARRTQTTGTSQIPVLQQLKTAKASVLERRFLATDAARAIALPSSSSSSSSSRAATAKSLEAAGVRTKVELLEFNRRSNSSINSRGVKIFKQQEERERMERLESTKKRALPSPIATRTTTTTAKAATATTTTKTTAEVSLDASEAPKRRKKTLLTRVDAPFIDRTDPAVLAAMPLNSSKRKKSSSKLSPSKVGPRLKEYLRSFPTLPEDDNDDDDVNDNDNDNLNPSSSSSTTTKQQQTPSLPSSSSSILNVLARGLAAVDDDAAAVLASSSSLSHLPTPKDVQFEEHLDLLEQADATTQPLHELYERRVRRFYCAQCRRHYALRNPVCIAERHQIKPAEVIERYFQCSICATFCTSFNSLLPTIACSACRSRDSFRRISYASYKRTDSLANKL